MKTQIEEVEGGTFTETQKDEKEKFFLLLKKERRKGRKICKRKEKGYF